MTVASCYLFRGLPAEKIKAIDTICMPQTLASGLWLYPKAEQARNIYLLEEGAVELLEPVEPDIEVPVALIRPGNDCVGIGALLEPYTYTLSARSKEPSRLDRNRQRRSASAFQVRSGIRPCRDDQPGPAPSRSFGQYP